MKALAFVLLATSVAMLSAMLGLACGGDKPPMVPDPDNSVIDAGAD